MAETVLMKQDMGKHIEFGVSDISKNADGTLTVCWGYRNSGTNLVRLNPEDGCLEVNKGSVLFLRDVPKRFLCGNHMRDFEMIMLEDAELVWRWLGKEFRLSSSHLYECCG